MRNWFAGRGPSLFATFFIWSVGTGSMALARPLFAASFGVSVFFVTLVTASNALARLITAPITGYLVDRFGRRPLVVAGTLLRALSALAIYFAPSYEAFLLFEFIGGIGISIFNTGSSVIIADLSGNENRGRAVAMRTTSLRLGTVSGPFFGTIIAALFDLRAIFLFNAVTKLIALAMVLVFIGETRPETAKAGRARPAERLDLSLFASKAFVAVMVSTLAINMAGSGGAFQAVFPLHAQSAAGFSVTDIGNMITLSGVIGFLIAYPNGMLVDRIGRKATLIPGLLLLAVGVILLAGVSNYGQVVLAVAVLGLGDGASSGTNQVFAMDMAPDDRRGAFLGVWTLFQGLGGLIAPLAVGLVADHLGYQFSFNVVAVWVLLATALMVVWGPETGKRRGGRTPAASTPAA